MQSVTNEETTPDSDVSVADVLAARQRIGGFIKRTPLERSEALSERLGCRAYLKMELFQKTGAFKVRGAFNKLLSLMETQSVRGVVAVSGGNHGQGVAYAARALGMAALILVPEKTPPNYVEAMRGYGARVERARTLGDAFRESTKYQEEGWYFIHPFDDPLVIAGQGTLGLEIVEECPQVTDVVVSVGGGGLAGGLAVAIKAERPGVRIYGVETEGADSMARALAAGRVVELPDVTSIAHTLGAPAVSERTLALAKRYLESVTVVPDAEAISEMVYLLERMKTLTEPAASCTVAAASRLRTQFSKAHHVVLVLCGGNVALEDVWRFRESLPGAMLERERSGDSNGHR